MNHSESIAKLAVALSKAQGTMKHAIKDADNPFFRSKYADLASVVEASRPSLIANGLSVVQCTAGNVLWTMLLHESGEWIKGSIELKPMRQAKLEGKDKAEWVDSHDPQSYGSCITYARRYAMAAITGVATEDDDGNAASGNKVAPKTPPVVPPVPPGSTQTPTVTIGTVQIPLVPPDPVHKEADSSSEQNDARDELALVCSKIADIMGMDAGSVLYQLTINKAGKFGKRSPNDIQWEANGPKGIWYPLKAVLSKAKKQLEELQKPTDDDVIPEDDIKY